MKDEKKRGNGAGGKRWVARNFGPAGKVYAKKPGKIPTSRKPQNPSQPAIRVRRDKADQKVQPKGEYARFAGTVHSPRSTIGKENGHGLSFGGKEMENNGRKSPNSFAGQRDYRPLRSP